MKKIWMLLLMIIPAYCISCGKQEEKEFIKITSVYDGDTFTDENQNKYRLLGVDTPEISSGIEFKATEGLEEIYAKMAKFFSTNLLQNNFVHIKKIKKDMYKRNIVKVFIENNKTLGELLVEKGLARVAYISNEHTNIKYKYAPDYYHDDEKYIKKLYDKQLIAAQEKRGFWQEINNFKIIFPKA